MNAARIARVARDGCDVHDEVRMTVIQKLLALGVTLLWACGGQLSTPNDADAGQSSGDAGGANCPQTTNGRCLLCKDGTYNCGDAVFQPCAAGVTLDSPCQRATQAHRAA